MIVDFSRKLSLAFFPCDFLHINYLWEHVSQTGVCNVCRWFTEGDATASPDWSIARIGWLEAGTQATVSLLRDKHHVVRKNGRRPQRSLLLQLFLQIQQHNRVHCLCYEFSSGKCELWQTVHDFFFWPFLTYGQKNNTKGREQRLVESEEHHMYARVSI